MKTNALSFPRSYRTALRTYLRAGAAASLDPAGKLGRRAVRQNLKTLALAKIHETALITLLAPGLPSRTIDSMIRRAGAFFAEAIAPIEETRPGAKRAGARLKMVIQSLSRRSVQLAASNKKLEDEIHQRREAEKTLRTSEQTTSLLLDKSRSMQEELRHLSRRLLTAQEEERKRISRELHDVIAQSLASINVRLAGLKTLSATNTKDLNKNIAQTQKLIGKSVDIVHRFARDLRPAVLDDLGLIPALQSHAKVFAKQNGIPVVLNAYAGVEKLDIITRTALYRVAQESLTNVARHAQASRVEVDIQEHPKTVRMMIQDNGKGFSMENTLMARRSKRLGLLGMRERVEMVDGTFSIRSSPGEGTCIQVDLPRGGRHPRFRPPEKRPRQSREDQ